MAYGNNNNGAGSYGRGNSGGRDAKIVKRTKVKESKSGATYEYAYAEIKGTLYKISITNCNKDSDKDNAGQYWIGIQGYGPANGGNRGGGGSRSYGNRY